MTGSVTEVGTANLTYTYAGKDNTFAAVGGSGLRNYTVDHNQRVLPE